MSSWKGHLHPNVQRNEHETVLVAFIVCSMSNRLSGSTVCGNSIRSMLDLKNHFPFICNINITLPTVCMFLNILQVKVGI